MAGRARSGRALTSFPGRRAAGGAGGGGVGFAAVKAAAAAPVGGGRPCRRRAAVGRGVADHLVVQLAPDHAGVPAEHLVADPLAGQHRDLPDARGLLERLQQPGPHERIQGPLAAPRVAAHRVHQGSGRCWATFPLGL